VPLTRLKNIPGREIRKPPSFSSISPLVIPIQAMPTLKQPSSQEYPQPHRNHQIGFVALWFGGSVGRNFTSLSSTFQFTDFKATARTNKLSKFMANRPVSPPSRRTHLPSNSKIRIQNPIPTH